MQHDLPNNHLILVPEGHPCLTMLALHFLFEERAVGYVLTPFRLPAPVLALVHPIYPICLPPHPPISPLSTSLFCFCPFRLNDQGP